jgi:hypothetical protein
MGSGAQRFHLAVTHVKQAPLSQNGPSFINSRIVKLVISPVARDNLRHHRPTHWVQAGQHDFQLRQVRPMILTSPNRSSLKSWIVNSGFINRFSVSRWVATQGST